MSPPLVVAYALAGTINIDLSKDPIGKGSDGAAVYLKDLWPTQAEVDALIESGLKPDMFLSKYSDLKNANAEWNDIQSSKGEIYEWDVQSTYIQNPPFFENFTLEQTQTSDLSDFKASAIVGDSITTDHISPAGAIK